MKRLYRELQIVFSPYFIFILLMFSVIIACGNAASLLPTDTIGNMLINEFGGCIWAEENELGAVMSWFLNYLPSGIAVSIYLHYKVHGMLSMEGYRHRQTIRWYASLVFHCLIIVLGVVIMQVCCSVLLAFLNGHRGLTIWIQDADGFTIASDIQPRLAPILFFLYDMIVVLSAVIAYLAFHRMTFFYYVFILPSLVAAMLFYKPFEINLVHLVNHGMACRLSVEGEFGIPIHQAIRSLVTTLVIVGVGGGFYCRIIPPYDKKFE